MRRISDVRALIAGNYISRHHRSLFASIAARQTDLIEVSRNHIAHLDEAEQKLLAMFPNYSEEHERFENHHSTFKYKLIFFVEDHTNESREKLSEFLRNLDMAEPEDYFLSIILFEALFTHIDIYTIWMWLVKERRLQKKLVQSIKEIESILFYADKFCFEFGYMFEALDLIHYNQMSLSSKAIILMKISGTCENTFEGYKELTRDRKEIVLSALSDSTKWGEHECTDLYSCPYCNDRDILTKFKQWYLRIDRCLQDKHLSLRAKSAYTFLIFHEDYDCDYELYNCSADNDSVIDAAINELYEAGYLSGFR
ncbi:hypothetical protein [Paenibacillus polymyxa]|uniref:hypothetical protein n=1 Tax=Paenibacillus polymyxa TaxID=1406 RepID=UPI0025B718B4|nr:hypothetical protein [Paenibacillus polymyxa]MDN4106117.1 hypothetical protein [Paenibacillus polymyxa]